jgi:hypothetical protein
MFKTPNQTIPKTNSYGTSKANRSKNQEELKNFQTNQVSPSCSKKMAKNLY